MSLLIPDLINGGFELLAGVMVLNHCRVLRADKSARGVSALSIVFFTLWGVWNLYYYPALGQSLSFYGGLFVVAANIVYVLQIRHYRRCDRVAQRLAQRRGSLGCLYDGR